MAIRFGELDDPRTEGHPRVRALDSELVWLAHEHEPWRPSTCKARCRPLSGVGAAFGAVLVPLLAGGFYCSTGVGGTRSCRPEAARAEHQSGGRPFLRPRECDSILPVARRNLRWLQPSACLVESEPFDAVDLGEAWCPRSSYSVARVHVRTPPRLCSHRLGAALRPAHGRRVKDDEVECQGCKGAERVLAVAEEAELSEEVQGHGEDRERAGPSHLATERPVDAPTCGS